LWAVSLSAVNTPLVAAQEDMKMDNRKSTEEKEWMELNQSCDSSISLIIRGNGGKV